MTNENIGPDRIGLMAPGPSPESTEDQRLYEGLIGDWEFDNEYYREDGSVERATGEWHFAWALEGRAIADLWTYPKLSERARTGEGPGGLGVTVRTYDPKTSSWNVSWNAANGRLLVLRGRRVGAEIVQESREEGGDLIRWIIYDIAPDSFSWRAEASPDEGATWRRTQAMKARRMEAGHA
jgi:hypothetical protein